MNLKFTALLLACLLVAGISQAQQKATTESLSKDINSLKVKLNQQNDAINKLNKENANLKAGIKILQENIAKSSGRTTYGSTVSSSSNVEYRLQKLEESAKKTTETGTASNYSGQYYSGNIDKRLKDVEDLLERMTGRSSSFWSMSNLSDLDTRVKGIEESVKKISGNNSSWNQPSVDDLAKRLDAVEGSVSKISGSSSSWNQPSMSDLEGRIKNVEESISKLSGSSSSWNQSSLSDLEKRISSLEDKTR